jgi:hypothetical protein
MAQFAGNETWIDPYLMLPYPTITPDLNCPYEIFMDIYGSSVDLT